MKKRILSSFILIACGTLAADKLWKFGFSSRSDFDQEEARQEPMVGARLPLSAYIDPVNGSVYQNENVQQLMDFAIIAHGKCGTTYLQNILRRHPETDMPEHELHNMRYNDIAGMIEALLELEPTKKRGYKAPNDLGRLVALKAIHQYWPDTKLIVGVRHPVSHFESWYNYNTRQGLVLKPAENMTVPEQSKFHGHLALLGKTNVLDPEEAELLQYRLTAKVQPPRMANKVFLYEVGQMFDTTEGRNVQFHSELQNFLGLKTPLFENPKEDLTKVVRPTQKSPNYHYAIDFCEDKYREMRGRLITHGSRAARWIKTYFMNLTDVTISNPEQFSKLLDAWSIDPCEKRLQVQNDYFTEAGSSP